MQVRRQALLTSARYTRPIDCAEHRSRPIALRNTKRSSIKSIYIGGFPTDVKYVRTLRLMKCGKHYKLHPNTTCTRPYPFEEKETYTYGQRK